MALQDESGNLQHSDVEVPYAKRPCAKPVQLLVSEVLVFHRGSLPFMRPNHTLGLLAMLTLAAVIAFTVFRRTPADPEVAPPRTAHAAPKPHLPTPSVRLTAQPAGTPPEEPPAGNAVARLLEQLKLGNQPSLDPAQLESFLAQRQRSAEALLAAAQATGDKTFLREAMDRFPNDPRVAYAAYYLSGPYDNQKPASPERRRWLDAFKEADPDNALPYYLAARDDFRAGQADAAVLELLAAADKPIEDYALDSIQNREEAYRSAGWPEAEARAVASSETVLPQLAELKQLSVNLTELANAYRQAGDPTSAEATLQMALQLGQELDRSAPFLINDLVAIAIEANALKAMDPGAQVGGESQTAQARLAAIEQRREEIKTVGRQVENLLPTLSDQDLANYFDRIKMFGEEQASDWLFRTHGSP